MNMGLILAATTKTGDIAAHGSINSEAMIQLSMIRLLLKRLA